MRLLACVTRKAIFAPAALRPSPVLRCVAAPHARVRLRACFATAAAQPPPAMSDAKRKAPVDDAEAGPAKAPRGVPGGALVHPARVRVLPLAPGSAAPPPGDGPVLYWMSRDQRAADNWALLHAAEAAAARGAPVAVVFNLVPAFMGAGARQFGFMLRGLRETAATLAASGVPFFLLRGDPGETVPALARELGASLLVTDFSPLRLGRDWRAAVAAAAPCAVHEVDAHNVVPVWEASPKLEYAARTIRPKIMDKLPLYLTEFPPLPPVAAWRGAPPPPVDWDGVIAEAVAKGAAVPEVSWAVPGEAAARAALEGDAPNAFLPRRLKLYEKRNDPNVPGALSGLSPWLHFGQLAPQRAALAAKAHSRAHGKAVEGFIEELVVRRELADNFCLHNASYDSLAGASQWARDSLQLHSTDKREFLYTRCARARAADGMASTHASSRLTARARAVSSWRRARRTTSCGTQASWRWCTPARCTASCACTGPRRRAACCVRAPRPFAARLADCAACHAPLQILEWTASPEVALADAIYLNDRYSLDGRDPNGYVGCMWSIAGIHDMGWAERPVFGKIRYMNYAGCKRKFDIEAYINRISVEVRRIKAAAAAAKTA